MKIELEAETGWMSSVLKGGGTEFVIPPLGGPRGAHHMSLTR
jgi:hypothetical protein